MLVNIDLNDARKVLENSGTAVMGQANVEGENRAIEAVIEALDSPLLNDNDITGAQQVLLKIVTGDGDGEIKMSELAKIKNKIQESAGTNVNIIEGIGIDPDLGMAISVTVIATGFEERKKPKGPTTVKLDEDNFDTIIEIEDEGKDVKKDKLNSFQQTLLLDEDMDNKMIKDDMDVVLDQVVDKVAPSLLDKEMDDKMIKADSEVVSDQVLDAVVPSENAPKTIVFDLGNDVSDELSDDKEESLDQIKSSVILEEDSVAVKQTVDLDLKHELEEGENLNTFEGTEVNTEVMKIESREREERLRNISMQLRTPSGLTSLEDVPAYKRNKVEIIETTHSSDSENSTYTLTSGDNTTTELKQNNSFLHDNVD